MEVQDSILRLVEINLTRIGLLLDLLGAAFLYWGGTPPMWRPSYAVIGPDNWDAERERHDYELEASRWKRWCRIGLGLLMGGFGLQLLGTLVAR